MPNFYSTNPLQQLIATPDSKMFFRVIIWHLDCCQIDSLDLAANCHVVAASEISDIEVVTELPS